MVFVCVTAQYGSCSLSATDISRRCTNVVKTERVDVYQQYDVHNVSSEQRGSVSGNGEDNTDGDLAELNVWLNDVMEVIGCDPADICDASTSSATCLPNCELTPYISNARLTDEHVSPEAEINQVCISSVQICSAAASPTYHSNGENSAVNLLGVESRCASRSNALSAAFSADQRLHNQPKKPT